MRVYSIYLLAGALIIATVAGCAPPAITPTGQAGAAMPTVDLIAPATPGIAEEEPVINGVPISTPFDPALQRIIAQVKDDLAGRLRIDSDQVELVAALSVTWPDGSLGCPRPGMAYIQVQVDGLLIRLKAGGRIYEYHGGGARPPFLCEQGL